MHMNKMQTRECWLAHTKKRFTRMNTHDDGDSLGNDDELVHARGIKTGKPKQKELTIPMKMKRWNRHGSQWVKIPARRTSRFLLVVCFALHMVAKLCSEMDPQHVLWNCPRSFRITCWHRQLMCKDSRLFAFMPFWTVRVSSAHDIS